MPRFDLEWQSTPDERYDTDMNARAAALVPRFGTLVSSEGGSSDGIADNNLVVDCVSATAASLLADAVANEVGHPVRYTVLS